MSATAVMQLDSRNQEPDKYFHLHEMRSEKFSTHNDNELSEAYIVKVYPNQVVEFRRQSPIIKNLQDRVISSGISERWLSEGIEEPNYLSKIKAFEVAALLYNEYSFFPERVGASSEGGIMLHYINYNNDKTLSIEIDNDLEIAAIINQYKTIVKSADIFNMDFSDIVSAYAS